MSNEPAAKSKGWWWCDVAIHQTTHIFNSHLVTTYMNRRIPFLKCINMVWNILISNIMAGLRHSIVCGWRLRCTYVEREECAFKMSFPVGNSKCTIIDTDVWVFRYWSIGTKGHLCVCVCGDPGIMLITNEWTSSPWPWRNASLALCADGVNCLPHFAVVPLRLSHPYKLYIKC